MNTIQDRTDSRESTNRGPLVRDGLIPAEPRVPVALRSVRVHSSHGRTKTPSHLTTTWLRGLACDANSSGLVNFPFAFTAFLVLTIGLIVLGCGIILISVSLSVVGFFFTLIAGVLHGWSLGDD